MKLRIKGNSLRIRLTRPEVEKLADTGYLEEQTSFGGNSFVYALQAVDATDLSASLSNNKISMLVPLAFIKDWPRNDVVGFNATMTTGGNDDLNLLLEKDFVCLEETTEDQSDHYDNPNKSALC